MFFRATEWSFLYRLYDCFLKKDITPANCSGQFISDMGNVCLKPYSCFGKFNLTRSLEIGLVSWWNCFHSLIVYNGDAASLY